MSIVQALRACAVPVRLAAVIALAVGLAAPALAVETRIGVDSVEFSWSEASGDPPYYGVWLTRDSGDFAFHTLVEENRIEVDVAPGDRIAIYVRGVRPQPEGGWQMGPASDVSSTVYVLAPATHADAEPGSWIVHCPGCGGTQQRDLADARITSPHFQAGGSWKLVTRADLADGSRWVVWKHLSQPQLGLSSLDAPEPEVIGPVAMPPGLFEGTIDISGDGVDEFLFLRPGSGNRLDRYALDASGLLVWTGSAPGQPGAKLGPIADYDGDGRDDLLWHDRSSGYLAVWSFTDFLPQLGRWFFSDSYAFDFAPSPAYRAVAAADYDGDGETDVLWRADATGDLRISYLEGTSVQLGTVPRLPGDERLEVVGSPDIDGSPGAEIAVRNVDDGRLWVLYPSVPGFPAREAVIDTGSGSQILYVGP